MPYQRIRPNCSSGIEAKPLLAYSKMSSHTSKPSLASLACSFLDIAGSKFMATVVPSALGEGKSEREYSGSRRSSKRKNSDLSYRKVGNLLRPVWHCTQGLR